MSTWTPDRFFTYEFSNGNEIVTLVIPTESGWSEEVVNDVAFADLSDQLGGAEGYWWEHDSRLSTAKDMETMGGVFSHLRNKEN
jgi:hypothetical protein